MKRPPLANLVALAFALIGGGAVVRLVREHHPTFEPFTVVDAWGRDGGVVVVALTIVCAFGYLVARGSAVRELASTTSSSPTAASSKAAATGPLGADRTLAIALAAVAVLVLWAGWGVALSGDVYAYAAYGEIARRNVDPAVPLSSDDPLQRDPFVLAARAHWPDGLPPCVYGPLFVLEARAAVAAAVSAAGGTSAAAVAIAVDALRVVALLGLGAAALALGTLVRGRREAEGVVAAVVVNPVVLWAALEGHNDTLSLALGLAGIAFARRAASVRDSRAAALATVAAAATASLGALVKVTGVSAVVFALGTRRGRGRLSGAESVAGAIALGALVAALIAMLPALRHVEGHSTYHPQYSLQGALGLASTSLLAAMGAGGPAAATPGIVVAYAICAALALSGGQLAWGAPPGEAGTDRRRRARTMLGIAAFAALPNPQPWYAVWFAPLAAVGLFRRDGRIAPAALGLWAATILLVVRYLPDAAGEPDMPERILVSLMPLVPIAIGLLAEYGGTAERRPLSTKADP